MMFLKYLKSFSDVHLVSRLQIKGREAREVCRKQDVVGLDVSMQDASLVQVVDSFEELSTQESPDAHLRPIIQCIS